MKTQLRSIREIDVVLASTAAWRSDILTRLTIPHLAVPPRYSEPDYGGQSPETFVTDIAGQKAASIRSDFPAAMIIAADQLIFCGGEVLGKPGSRENAIRQLMWLNGRRHRLICAVAVDFRGQTQVRCETASLKMRQLTASEIEFYVDHDQPIDCAGSYRIEALGAALFEEIQVRDANTIVGLPVNLLLDIIREWGFSNLI
jgi:septum formation protein